MDATPHASTHLDDELDAVLIGGREPGPVEIVAYDPRWRARFEAERRNIAAALGPLARRIEHIGSTSVPDLAAKPIVDVLVEVDDPAREEDYAGHLSAAGYELRVREPRHRMFRTPARDVHVHVWPSWLQRGRRLPPAARLAADARRRPASLREREARARRTAVARPQLLRRGQEPGDRGDHGARPRLPVALKTITRLNPTPSIW